MQPFFKFTSFVARFGPYANVVNVRWLLLNSHLKGGTTRFLYCHPASLEGLRSASPASDQCYQKPPSLRSVAWGRGNETMALTATSFNKSARMALPPSSRETWGSLSSSSKWDASLRSALGALPEGDSVRPHGLLLAHDCVEPSVVLASLAATRLAVLIRFRDRISVTLHLFTAVLN